MKAEQRNELLYQALVVDHRDFDRFTEDRIKRHAPIL